MTTTDLEKDLVPMSFDFGDNRAKSGERNSDDLIHYQGELGDFWYDPNEFEIEHTKNDTLHYKGNDLSVSLPEGYINTRGVFEGCELPEGFTLGDKFDTSKVTSMEGVFSNCKLPEGFSLGEQFDISKLHEYLKGSR